MSDDQLAAMNNRIRATARAHQRRILRRIGTNASTLASLDPLGLELLHAYVRKVATIEQLPAGELRIRLENGSARDLLSLERRLRAAGLVDGTADPMAALRAHVAGGNGANDTREDE